MGIYPALMLQNYAVPKLLKNEFNYYKTNSAFVILSFILY